MLGPFIFIATNRLTDEAERRGVPGLVGFSEAGEPRSEGRADGQGDWPRRGTGASLREFARLRRAVNFASAHAGRDQRDEATHADRAATWTHWVGVSAEKRQALRHPA
jgi:hypothetical protein